MHRTMEAAIARDVTFVVGGARSGKSAFAERLAAESGCPVTYVATARTGDAEFDARIAHHRARRPAHWSTLEVDVDLAGVLAQADAPGHCVLVDCLTLWLANLLCPLDGVPRDDWPARIDALIGALDAPRARVVVVSNEIGLGVVPLGVETRRYVDELGRLNQRVAALATRVTLMVAGIPVAVKA
jgi:adenosylcobinamide kinase/adenosylcobinamide-phosphate guanylyltransferase